MSFNIDDPIQLLQLRVGALEYMIKQLAAAQPQNVQELIEVNTRQQIELWKEKSPEIVEIMVSTLSLLPSPNE